MNKVSRTILPKLDKTKVKFLKTEEKEPLQKGQAGGRQGRERADSPAGPRKEVVRDGAGV